MIAYLDWWCPIQFLNLVGSSDFRVGDNLESCTDRVQPHLFTLDGYDVTLVDVPGFDDTNKSDSDLLRMIADFLFAE
jgi:predicted GTPase